MRAPRSITAPRDARTFVTCALLLGLFYAFLSPPFSVADESAHFLRLRDLSRGVTVSQVDELGGYHRLDPAFVAIMARYEPLVADAGARVELDQLLADLATRPAATPPVRIAAGARSASPVAHLPAAPFLYVARLLQLPLLPQLYLARLIGVVCFALLGGYACVLAGRLGWAFFALGLLPMTLTQAAGASGQAVINGLALLFFALVARGALLDAPLLTRKQRLLLLCSFVLLVLCRPVFLVSALCLPALRGEHGQPARHRYALPLLALLLAVLALSAWAAINGSLFDLGELASPGEQWSFLCSEPRRALFGWLRSSFKQLDEHLIELSAFRESLSAQLRFAGGAVAALSLQLIFYLSRGVLAAEPEPAAGPRAPSAWFTLTFVLSVVATILTTYLTRNKPGTLFLQGVESHTLIANAPLLLMALSSKGRPTVARFLGDSPPWRIVLPVVLLNALCLFSLFGRFFAPASFDWPY